MEDYGPMKTFPLCAILRMLPLLLCAVSMSHAQGRIVEPADIIVISRPCYTENPQLPWAQAVRSIAARSSLSVTTR